MPRNPRRDIGDALAPGAIVRAIHSGHLYAGGLNERPDSLPDRLDAPFSEIMAPERTPI